MYKPEIEIEQRGYEIAVSNEDSGNAPAKKEEPLDIEALMVAANAELGKVVVKKCVSCHSLDKGGANKIGPNLWAVVGRQKGVHEGFKFSGPITKKGGTWTREDLAAFLHKPQKFLPGTKMSSAGLRKKEDIANVIAYLETLSN